MRFVVDAPLGGLAKWLRLCGFDVVSHALAAGAGLPPPAADAYLLSGRPDLARLHRQDLLILTAATPEAQLREVFQRLHLSRRHLAPLSRCARCNEPLAPIPRQEVLGRVPDFVWHTQREFCQCPRCRRLYWPGSHLAGITARLEEMVEARRPSGPPRQKRRSA